MTKKTAIVILAAGASKRLGTPKQLLPYRNTYLLAHCLQQVCSIPNSDVFVVLGYNADVIAKKIASFSATLLVNPNWEKGMGNSLAYATKHLKNYKKVLISLGDLPLLKTQHYTKLLAHHNSSTLGITKTNYENFSGVPVVFDAIYFEQLALLNGDEGAKNILKTLAMEVGSYPIKLPYVDVDTKEDYNRLLSDYNPL